MSSVPTVLRGRPSRSVASSGGTAPRRAPALAGAALGHAGPPVAAAIAAAALVAMLRFCVGMLPTLGAAAAAGALYRLATGS